MRNVFTLHKLLFITCIFWMMILFPVRILATETSMNEAAGDNILIINSYNSGLQWTDGQTDGIISVLGELGADYTISIEYMDWKRFPTKENANNFYMSTKEKYADVRIDLVICTDDAALQFAKENRDEIFPAVPIVFSGINSNNLSLIQKESEFANYTGVVEEINPEDTIRTAIQINPTIQNIYLIYDNTESGTSTAQVCIEAVEKVNPDLNVISLNDESRDAILDLAANTKKNSMILVTTYFTDIDGTPLNHQRFCQQLSAGAKVPVYHLFDFGMRYGIFGGYLTAGFDQGEQAGILAMRILNGEKPDDIAIINLTTDVFTYDYSVAQRFSIDPKQIPASSQVTNRANSFIEAYQPLVITIFIAFTVLVSFTVILLFHISKSNKMKRALADNNEELSELYDEIASTEEELRAQMTDLTDAHERLEQYTENMQHLAYHDDLTGLYNRLYLYETVGDQLARGKMDGAVFFIDLDNFKFINDALGHAVGDDLLREISKRLLTLLSDETDIVRLGGDEFVICRQGLEYRKAAEEFADRITAMFLFPFSIQEHLLSITASIGIAMYKDHSYDIDMLIRNADMAMYKVKKEGKNGFHFFNTQLKEEILERITIENCFKSAIRDSEFQIHYQPQVLTKSTCIDGFEALIRWDTKELGFLSPDKFISVAEETGFIIVLGEWVLRTACDTISKLNTRLDARFKVGVNISVLQILQDDFVDMVKQILKETHLAPELLELEITESVLMDSKDAALDKIKQMRKLGIKIAIDDFGTGFSSLAYLRTIPITTLKIDKLFVDDIANPLSNTDVTDSIIDLGHKMNLIIVAEGVESASQLSYLQENGCDLIQGYFYSRPLPLEALEDFILDFEFTT